MGVGTASRHPAATGTHRGAVLRHQPRSPLHGQALQGVKVKPLLQGQELPRDGLGRARRPCPALAPRQPTRRSAPSARSPQEGSRCPLVATERLGTAEPTTSPLTFIASWAASAPMKDATGHSSPVLTLANARTTSSSRGPSAEPSSRASSSTHSASSCGQRGNGSAVGGHGLGRGGWEATHRCPGLGQAALLLVEGVQSPEGGVQSAAAQQLRGAPGLDPGHRQRPAEGLLLTQHGDRGDTVGARGCRWGWQCRGAGARTYERSWRGRTSEIRPPPRYGEKALVSPISNLKASGEQEEMGVTVTTRDPHSPQGGHSPSTRTGQGSLLFSSTMPSTPENTTRSPSLKRWPRFLSAPAQVTIPGLP